MVMVTIPVATYHFVDKVGKIPSRDAGMAARHSK
jgi:hypothetical protein